MPFLQRLWRNIRRYPDLYLMMLPALAIVIIFSYIPMYGIQLAFREFNPLLGLSGGKWVGMKYIEKFTASYQFWNLIANTLRLSLGTLIFSFPVPIMLALVFNHLSSRRGKRIMQTVVYLPHFISTVVMVGMLQVFFSSKAGLMNTLVRIVFGYEGNLLGDTKLFPVVYVFSEIWQHAGWNSIIYFAALSSIDAAIYDAAKIDGANGWQTILHIDLPALVPTCIILLVLNMGSVLSVGFEKAYLMQNSLNIPVSEVISTYVYKIGMVNSQYSYSAAISLFNTVINFSLVFVVNMIARRVGNISLW